MTSEKLSAFAIECKKNKESLCNVRKLYDMSCETCINYQTEECPKISKRQKLSKRDICEINGKSKSIEDWAKEYNLTIKIIMDRYYRGTRGERLIMQTRKYDEVRAK